ncbi:MAG: 5-oxoprolinase subunit PxpB [Methylophaga sp.]|nr:5-oxoprolinase subunit PxpB [Methylophaga sp.]
MATIKLAGENAIIIYFGEQAAPELADQIAFYTQQLLDSLGDVIIDVVPSYTSLMISYRLNLVSHYDFCDQVEQVLSNSTVAPSEANSNLIEIPVYYGLEVGLDLDGLLTDKGLSLEEFIAIHSSKTYLVYAIGFSPAFAFLGKVDDRISVSRLACPRIKIPAGSIGIADNQTAVYPITSSGGWNIIGRTPLDLSLNKPENIKRFSVGDRVRFMPISQEKYCSLGGIL